MAVNLQNFEGIQRRRMKVGDFELSVIDVGEGPAILLLHGFPSSSAEWRYQIPVLVKEGYRVIAPDLLGQGKSDKPLDWRHYTVAKEVERMLSLLGELGIHKTRIVGHDRGGGICWNIAANHPTRVEQFVTMIVGHSNLTRTPSIEQREKSWYNLFFQLPIAEEALKKDNWRLFRDWLRNHPDVDSWIEDLSPDGALTAALGWYRANWRPDAPFAPPLPDVMVPGLGLWTTSDPYRLPDFILESYRYMRAPWRTERVDGVSHFMMIDRPDYVTKLIVDFFRQHRATNQDQEHAADTGNQLGEEARRASAST
jgi:pimeloyl-ACP methyl ester carboxylesterase